jgi:hypothetical protein
MMPHGIAGEVAEGILYAAFLLLLVFPLIGLLVGALFMWFWKSVCHEEWQPLLVVVGLSTVAGVYLLLGGR